MEEIKNKRLTGERALFGAKNVWVEDCIFADGESPLKESENVVAKHTSFQWKYPLWYSRNVLVDDCTFLEMGRAGIWYADNITVKNTLYEAPKGFRRVSGLLMENVDLPHAEETLWSCDHVTMKNVVARGDYFAMNCSDMVISDFRLAGNYCFDGCKNVEVHNAKLLSKDAFWNCENVTVYNSYITGEYLGWNSKNITFVNCTIESLQGMCYIENLVMKDCKLINTTLAFEYSSVKVENCTCVESVLNPKEGLIELEEIGELIVQENRVDASKTEIRCENVKKKSDCPEWER